MIGVANSFSTLEVDLKSRKILHVQYISSIFELELQSCHKVGWHMGEIKIMMSEEPFEKIPQKQ